MEFVEHSFEPIFDEHSRILVLGTIPSPKSREQGFYYGHPRNRFWAVTAQVFLESVPVTIQEKKSMVLRHGMAVWDVLASCAIEGAEDASIREPRVNDLNRIFRKASIEAVFTTGNKATSLYQKYCAPIYPIPYTGLPSTSPANCKMGLAELVNQYGVLRIRQEDR